MKATMPTPCAYLYTTPSGARVVDLKRVDLDTPGLTVSDLIAVEQAEAYADVRVREAQQWISVEDRMPPEDDTLVLALHGGNEPEVVFGFLLHETLDTWAYTHWMHIPPLPGPASHNHP